VTDAAVRASPRDRTLLDRFLAAVPVAALALVVLTFYGVEAWLKKTPWVFTDELEWTQLSRSIAATGHAARRGEPIYFKSLYAWLIAPAWWLHSTSSAYAAIKYLNVVVMTATAIPTYLLARMLVSRRAALAVAVLSVCIPAMTYATSLIPEVLAYPYYALSSYVIVRALATRRPAWIAGAIAVSVGALLVRNQLMTVGGSFALAAAILAVTGDRGRRLRAHWTRADHVGAAILVYGALILGNRVFGQHVLQWQISTQYWKGRMFDLGLTAGSAFAVGLGLLPVIGGLSSLALRERRGDPAYRAFAAYLAATVVTLSLYTAVKAAYLSTIFAQLTEERNLIYLSPLLLVGTALCYESRRVSLPVAGAAALFVLYLVLAKPRQLGYPYFEAPGYGILTLANRNFHWDGRDLSIALFVAWLVALAFLAPLVVPGLRARFARPAAVIGAVAVAAWMLTAQIESTRGDEYQAETFFIHLPQPVNWVQVDAHGADVTYLGQQIRDANGLWLHEFWNPAIKHVYSLDGTAPGPGPTVTPDIAAPNGRLTNFTGTPYVLADNGVTLAAPLVARRGELRLYRVHGGWRLLQALQAVDQDGWAGPFAGFTYFKPGGPGMLRVTLSRTAHCGAGLPGRATVLVGPVKLDASRQAAFAHVTTVRRAAVRNCQQEDLEIPVRSTPVRVEVHIAHTFRESASDPRHLGAQVSFSFARSKAKV
jgi:hypothetical protein